MIKFKFIASIFCLLTVLAFSGCGNSSGGSNDGGSGSGMGTLSLSLTDSSGDYQAVYVTIYEVQAHLGGDEDNNGNWQVVASSLQLLVKTPFKYPLISRMAQSLINPLFFR